MPRSVVLTAILGLGILGNTPHSAIANSTTSIDAMNPGETIVSDADFQPPIETGGRGVSATVLAQWSFGSHPSFAPVGLAMADIDASGTVDIAAGSTNNMLYAWDYTGAPLSGFPVNVGAQIQSKPALADLDCDGQLEILVHVKSGHVHAYDSSGAAVPGWPQATGFTYGFVAPSVYDLDDDGTPEVLIGGGSNVRAWRADGTVVPGWPQAVTGSITGTLAIADVVGDSAPEIFAISSSKELYAFHADGSAVTGFPINHGLSSSWAGPTIGDLDGDGTREVLIVGYHFGVDTNIFAYNGDGSVVSGFPLVHASGQTYSSPVVADADNNGQLEIYNAGKISGDAFYAWDHTGAVLPGWPVATGSNMESSAIVADFDGSPEGQIVIGDNSGPGSIFGFEMDGSVAAGFPIAKPGISYPNAPEVADVNADGSLNMAMATSGTVTVWSIDVPYSEERIEWGALFHDDWNTNQYGFAVPECATTSVPENASALTLSPAEPNPMAAGQSRVRFVLAEEDALIRASVYDASGRKVRALNAVGTAGAEQELRWDGRDGRGVASAAGVYFFRLETRNGAESVPVTIVR